MDKPGLSYELLQYENQWVAISEPEDRIVASGADAYEAQQSAKERGYADVLIMRVRATDARYAFKLVDAV
jgi:hypothetical protein